MNKIVNLCIMSIAMVHNPPSLNPLILLIDDDEDDVLMLTSALELLNIKVKSFDNGQEACAFLQSIVDIKLEPSLVICDYSMPMINGIDVIKLLKSLKETNHLHVILYSTTISSALYKEAIDLGAKACFTKPFGYKEFLMQVDVFKKMAFLNHVN